MHPPDFCQGLRAESSKFCAMKQLFSSSSCLWQKKEKNGWTEFRVNCLVWTQCTIHEHRRVLVINCALGRHFVTSTQYGTNLIMSDYWKSLLLRNGLPLLSSQQVKQFPADSPATQLVQVLKETDPDDSFSSVPYEKGSCFLYYLEQILGGPGFKILLSIQYSPEIRSKGKREANRTYISLCAHQCEFIFALFPDLMPTFLLLFNQRLGPMKRL